MLNEQSLPIMKMYIDGGLLTRHLKKIIGNMNSFKKDNGTW